MPQLQSKEKATVRADDLIAALDVATPTFLLVDPMLGEPLPGIDYDASDGAAQAARETYWDREITQIRLNDRISLPVFQHPYLVSLHGSTDTILELTLELAQSEQAKAYANGLDGQGKAAHRIGGWLQSSMHAADLANQFSNMCKVNTAAYTTAAYLRLADRRVLALLEQAVGEARVASMLGRIQRWCFLDALGEISAMNGMKMGEPAQALRLSEAEWDEMGLGEFIHRTLAKWLGEIGRTDAAPISQRTAADLYRQAAIAVRAARQASTKWPHRFLEPCDQTTFAALALLHP
jgi:hypothetical protein